MILFDSDLYDAELEVERTGRASFDKTALAAIIGVSVKSISAMKERGKIPPPDHYEDTDTNSSHARAIWTNAQVAELLARRNRG